MKFRKIKPKKLSAEEVKEEKERRDEVWQFITLLEARIGELAASVEDTDTLEDGVLFQSYRRFRELMSSCIGLSIIIEKRLPDLSGETVKQMNTSFDELTVAVWSILTLKALEFFNALSQTRFLPVGSREMFMNELKTLHDANNILRKEKYRGLIHDALWERLNLSEAILKEVVERAPSLLELG